jgi:hypothetical protein
MDFDRMVQILNEMLSKECPETFNSSWILKRAPRCYRFIWKNMNSLDSLVLQLMIGSSGIGSSLVGGDMNRKSECRSSDAFAGIGTADHSFVMFSAL